MGGALLIVWGIALLAILALGGLLLWTLRRQVVPDARPQAPVEQAGGLDVGSSETLLFYYEEESVRATPGGRVIVRIPGMAWESEWQDDLLRLEVLVEDPASIAVPEAWGAAEVLAAYALRAYRMTEIGSDIEVERFAAPVDVFITADERGGELRFGVNNREGWTLAPLTALSPQALDGVDIPAGRSWAAASIAGMREVCLVRMPEPDRGAEEPGEPAEDR
jgi:hypothetical protein